MDFLHREHHAAAQVSPSPSPAQAAAGSAPVAAPSLRSDSTTARPATSPQPDPSILLTFDGWLIGRLGEGSRRVSDALATSSVVELQTDGGPLRIDRDEILMVVPPPFDGDPSARVARRRCPVAVDLGAATVRGNCHVVPGTTPWDTWQRSTSGFAAVTDAVLDFPDGTSETADVVLISRYAARSGLLDR